MVYVSLFYTHIVKLNKKKPSTLILMYLLRFFLYCKAKDTVAVDGFGYRINLLFLIFQSCKNLCFKLFCQFRVVLDANFCRIASLAEFCIVVAVP